MSKQPDIKSNSLTPAISLLSTRRTPSVWFSDFAWAQLWAIIDLSNKEVGWFGLVDELPSGDFLIEELFVPKQTVTSTETDIEPEALNELAVLLETQGKDSSRLRYWGHSHVNMGVGPSKTDEDQIAEYIEHVDWFIRGIHNKKNQSKIDVYDVTANLIYQCVNTGRQPVELNDAAYDELINTLTVNVEERKYNYPVTQFPHRHRSDVFHGGIKGNPQYQYFGAEEYANYEVD